MAIINSWHFGHSPDQLMCLFKAFVFEQSVSSRNAVQ